MGSIDLLQTWRTANHTAVTATNVVLVKSLLAMDGKGEPPTASDIDEVRTLRCVADDLFELIIARSGEAVSARESRGEAEPAPEFASTWVLPITP